MFIVLREAWDYYTYVEFNWAYTNKEDAIKKARKVSAEYWNVRIEQWSNWVYINQICIE